MVSLQSESEEYKMNALEIEETLAQYYGTMQLHRWSFLFRKHVATDGVLKMAELCQAFWLLDAIASHQPKLLKDPMLRNFQKWTLTVKESRATLVCELDTDDVAVRQKIGYTNFPLPEMVIYVKPTQLGNGENVWVLMLVSEN